MRTLLSQFCDEFEAVVRPLLDPLAGAARSLAASGEELSARAILPDLRDATHQLEVVADKVGEQQAYVLIFGPLKSGKSTLMNSMCAAYVSEVTSLPAYPCMVYVSHAEKRELVVTRYDGEREVYSDLSELRLMLTRAHTELAAQIRRTEAEGEVFDPQNHYPQAIRRIDVGVPAGDLAQSGAVLVDTPGLYTRMKFGYDRMTREFRDTAACAIFVVKSENLFLEQVFEEFHQLLDHFSRIFLVVNLDSAKMDLKADGTLGPSLEREDPVRIIEAFENLAMSAPLKAATEEGRLRIYPVDLLRAASRRIRANRPAGVASEREETPSVADLLDVERTELEELDAPAELEPGFCGQADFDAFLGDLTDYLNSTDYLVAFLADSLRHASRLLENLSDLAEHPGVQQMGRTIETLTTDLNRAEHHGRTLARLTAHDWDEALGELRSSVQAATREATRDIRDSFAGDVEGAVEGWFRSDASLANLLDDELGPVFAQFRRELRRALRSALEARVFQGAGGLEPGPTVLGDLEAAGLDLDALGRRALPAAERPDGGSTDEDAPRIDVARIPVRKGFWDWILFRTKAQVRRRLLGAPNHPTRHLPSALKARHLGEPALEEITLAIVEELDVLYPDLVAQGIEELFGSYTQELRRSLENELARRSRRNEEVRNSLTQRLDAVAEVRERLDEVQGEVRDARTAMEDLTSRYGETEPEELVEPVEGEDAEEATDLEAQVPLAGSAFGTGPELDELGADLDREASEESVEELTPFPPPVEPVASDSSKTAETSDTPEEPVEPRPTEA